jgi:hypothetical protein
VLAYEGRGETYVVAWIEYNDIFPSTPRRRTEVCWRLALKADPRARVQDVTASLGNDQYGPHNGSDGDCLHKPMT